VGAAVAGLIVVGGPTASGKSAFALRLAERQRGTIINADSMQIYRELRILTARPGIEEEARAPHRLYGVLGADDPASAGRWLGLAEQAIGEALAEGRVPIVVGGTGLYLHALLHGIAPVPDVPAAARAEAEALFARQGGPGFHAELARRDPVMARRLRPSDRQRLIRAFEVVLATGRSLAEWQTMPHWQIRLPQPVVGIGLSPPRAELRARIAQRLQAMVDCGALAELQALRARQPDPAWPLMKAVAVPELLAHLEGRLSLEEAIARAIVQTRRYAKRQLTFLRHQLPELQTVSAFGDRPEPPETDAALRQLLLTV
jgi:tRNA dimethylallyltransferase